MKGSEEVHTYPTMAIEELLDIMSFNFMESCDRKKCKVKKICSQKLMERLSKISMSTFEKFSPIQKESFFSYEDLLRKLM